MNYVAHQYLKGISGQTTIFKWFSTRFGQNLRWCGLQIRTSKPFFRVKLLNIVC